MAEPIVKISVFDFDQTLINTPDKEEGPELWKQKTGEEWPHRGWWGRAETLDPNIFEIEPNQNVVRAYEKEYWDPNTLTVLMTGRHVGLWDEIMHILNKFGLEFDVYSLKKKSPTLDEKIEKIEALIDQYPDVKTLEIWEDREEHVKVFREWGDNKEQEVIVNHVT